MLRNTTASSPTLSGSSAAIAGAANAITSTIVAIKRSSLVTGFSLGRPIYPLRAGTFKPLRVMVKPATGGKDWTAARALRISDVWAEF
jgi:hypothetical protein